MFSLDVLIPFLSVSIMLAITPGPSNAFLMAQTFANGKDAGKQAAIGFALAGFIHTSLMVFGLSAILKTNPMAYQAILILGGCYLAYLGVITIKDSIAHPKMASEDKPHVANKKKQIVWRQAMTTELLNPKVALFYLAFIPQFANPELSIPVALQLVLFAVTYIALAFPIDLSYVHFGDKIAGYFRHHPGVEDWINRITGVVFILLAINLVI